jgi:hypothetical protein
MLNNKLGFLLVGLGLMLIQSCAPSRVVRPLEKGQKNISANLGGPLIGFAGTTIPMPLTSISYAQGVSDDVTLFGGFHTTSMLYGVIQTDIGACYNLYHPDSSQFGVSVNPVINFAFDTWEGNAKLWPEVDINAYWEFKPKKSFMYVGASNWFELSGTKAHDEVQENRWLFNPHMGYTYVRNKWNYNVETKYLVPNVDTEPNAVDYRGVAGKGAIGVYFTFIRKF